MNFRKFIVMLLTVCMIVTYTPLSAFAETQDKASTNQEDNTSELSSGSEDKEIFVDLAKTEGDEGELIPEESGLTYDTVKLDDDTVVQTFYSYPVRFEDEKGDLIDIEPEFIELESKESSNGASLKSYAYENKTGEYKTYIPSSLSEETPILMENDKYTFTMSPVDGHQGKVSAEDISAVYGTDKDELKLEYISQNDGVKENIILNERPLSNELSFILSFSGMTYRENPTDKGITFYDPETDDIVMGLASPFMNDSTGEAYSEDIEVKVEEIKEENAEETETTTLRYTLKISDKYLDGPERIYPITIDPTATWVGTSEVRDSYVISSTPNTNYYSTSTMVMPSGSGSMGVHRTYIHFLNLKNELIGANISSANLEIYETGGGRSGYAVRIYRITETWTNSGITWSNKPSLASSHIDSVSTNGTAHHKMTYDVTSWAKKVVNEDVNNYGLCLRNKTETGTTYTEFYGTRTGATSYRPKLTVVYTNDKPTQATKVSTYPSEYSKGKKVYVSWEGVKANKLQAIQYKIAKLNASGDITNSEYVPYTSIGSAASSGKHSIPNSANFPVGYYRVYIRGLSKQGVTGKYNSAKFSIVDKPTTPTSVKVGSSSIFKGDTNTVTWTGVTADHLDHIEYRIAKYDSNWSVTNSDYVPYTRLKGAVSAGSASIPNISSFPNGYYRIYIRGVSQSGTAGTGYGTKITIKKDADPKIGSIVFRKGDQVLTTYTQKGDITVDVTDITDDRSLSGKSLSYTVKNETVQTGSGTTALSQTDGKYKASFTIPESQIEDTADYTVKVSLKDIKNNTAELSGTLRIDNEKPTVNIESPASGDVLKGNAVISVKAEDSQSLNSMEVTLLDGDDNETILTNSQGVYNLDTTLYPDGVYRIKAAAWDKAGNRSEETNSEDHTAEVSVSIYNPPPTPSLALDRYCGRSDDDITVTWSYVSGDSSASKVDKLQIACIPEGEEICEADYSDLVTSDADISGSVTYSPSGLTEGRYTIYIRSVTASGSKCEPRSVTYVCDDTQPLTVLQNLPEDGADTIGRFVIRGSISDDNLAGYRISVSDSSGSDYREVFAYTDPQNTNGVNGVLGTVDLSDDSDYPVNSTVTLKIESFDEAGNNNTLFRTLTKRDIACDAPDFEIHKDQEGMISVTDETAAFILEGSSGQVYTANDPVWFIDGTRMTCDESGNLNLSDIPEDTLHTVSVYDRDTLGNISYGVTMTEMAYDEMSPEEETTAYISDGSISLSEGSSGIFVTEIPDTDDALSLRIESAENVPEGASVSYFLSVNDEGYIQAEKDEDILLTEEPFDLGTIRGNTIRLKAVLDKGTAADAPSVTGLTVIVRKPVSDTFRMQVMEHYEVSNVTAVPELNYKILVRWEAPADAADDDGISYEILRSRSSDFPENDTVIVQSGLKDNYWYDSYSLINEGSSAGAGSSNDISGVTFYYRIRTIRASGNGLRVSRGIDSPRADIVALDEYSKRLGLKDYWGYSELDVGAGTGYVEQSKGNFVYQETDCYVKGKVLDLEMTRTYNSMSTGTTALGVGWDFSFNPILLDMYDGYGDNKGMLFKDGSGTIYTFLNIPDGEGIEEKTENIDGTDTVTSIETHYKSPLGVYIHLRRIEALDKDDTDQDGDTSEVLDVNYVIETLSKDTYTFNRSCQITSYEDANGNTVLYAYTDDGKLKEAENRNGNSEEDVNSLSSTKRSRIQFSYFDSSEGNPALIKCVTMPNGQKIKYTYSSDNRLISAGLYGAGDGNESTITGRPVVKTDYEYSESSDGPVSMIKVTDPNDNKSEISYYPGNANNVGKCHIVTFPDNDHQEFIYDASFQTVEKTFIRKGSSDHEIGHSTVRYNADGNITYSQDLEGSIIETEYALGLVVKEKSEVDQYTILESGIIQHSPEDVSTVTEYEVINDNNMIASKIADTTGNVMHDTDIEGNTTEYEYEASGDANRENPTRIVTVPPETSAVTDGSVVSCEELSMHESFEYDQNGNPTKIKDDDTGEEIIYTYDEFGQVTSETFRTVQNNGTTVNNTTEYTYDDQGNLTSETSSNGSSPESHDRYMYDDFGRLIMEMNAGGYVTEHSYDALDREIRTVYYTEQYSSFSGVRISDPNVYEEWEYDANGNLTLERDREGKETAYTYDNMDRITSKTASLNGEEVTWTYTYSYEEATLGFMSGEVTVENAYVTTVTDPDNVITSKTYEDKAGNTIKTIENGESTAFRYNRDGECIEMYVIGLTSRLNEADPTEGRTVLSTYNKYGNLTASIIDPGWNGESYYVADDTIVHRYVYDTLGNLIEKKDPLGRSVRHSYDQNGRVISTETASSDPDSQAISETLAEYDIPGSNGNTVSLVRNAMGQYTETEEDPNGNTVRITDHGTVNDDKKIEITFTYDAEGNLISETDGNGTRYYSYDDMDNLVRSVYGGTLSEPSDYSDYTYDRFGMMTSRKDFSDGTFDRIALYRYDELKRLRKYYEGETEYQDDSDVDWAEYEYDIRDNLTRISYPSMPSLDYVAYNYGEYNRVNSVRVKEKDEQSDFLAREYTYDANGRVASLNDRIPGGRYLRKEYSYDRFGRCTEIEVTDNGNASVVLEHYIYTYDKCGNILTEEILNKGAQNTSGDISDEFDHFSSDGICHMKRYYTYNELDELIGVREYSVSDTGEETALRETAYTYDEIGNRTSEESDGNISEYTYDSDGLNLLVSVVKEGEGGTVTTGYTYDHAGNVTRMSYLENDTETVTDYTYDSLGRLLTATVTSGNNDPVVTENVYDGAGYRIAKKVGDATTHYYVAGGAVLFTWETEEGSETETITSENAAGIDGQIFLTKRSDEWYAYTNDLRRSVTGIIGAEGAYLQAVVYDVYGKPEIYERDNIYNEIYYTGAVYDETTGLYYLSSRYYDPSTGRFASMDSVRGGMTDPLSLNLFIYCEGNPVKYTDQDGESPAVIGAVVGGVIGAAAEIITQYAKHGKVKNWKGVLARIAGGAASGALATFGLGWAGGTVADVLVNSVEELAYQWGTKKKIDWKEFRANVAIGTGLSFGFNAPKGILNSLKAEKKGFFKQVKKAVGAIKNKARALKSKNISKSAIQTRYRISMRAGRIKKKVNPKHLIKKTKVALAKGNRRKTVTYIKSASKAAFTNKHTRSAAYSVGGPRAANIYYNRRTARPKLKITRSPSVKYVSKGKMFMSSF